MPYLPGFHAIHFWISQSILVNPMQFLWMVFENLSKSISGHCVFFKRYIKSIQDSVFTVWLDKLRIRYCLECDAGKANNRVTGSDRGSCHPLPASSSAHQWESSNRIDTAN